jgi:L-ascorbate metabolism protein UlaG (beta-lactamase superfamily)
MFRWKVLDSLVGRRKIGAEPFTPPVRENDGVVLRDARASITWIGHATFALKLGGRVIATDPIWSSRIAGAVPRLAPPGIAFENMPPIEVVTISHNHFDHLDLPTLKKIGPNALFVVPLGVAPLLASAGLTRVIELDWWQSARAADLEITLVPARHWSMRTPWNRNDSLWGGFVVRAPEAAIYHAGDTASFDGFREIGERAGPIDYAMLPIGAYEPRWFMEPQHMCPEEAGEAFLALGAKKLIAMHWATFRLTDEPLAEPPARLREWFAAKTLDRDRLWIPDIGESAILSA